MRTLTIELATPGLLPGADLDADELTLRREMDAVEDELLAPTDGSTSWWMVRREALEPTPSPASTSSRRRRARRPTPTPTRDPDSPFNLAWPGVPHFVLREGVSGAGLEVSGPAEVEQLVDALRRVHSALESPPLGDGFGLQQPRGMVLPGYGGRRVLLTSVDRLGGPSLMSLNLQGWDGPEVWPYSPDDFRRDDERDDAIKYGRPASWRTWTRARPCAHAVLRRPLRRLRAAAAAVDAARRARPRRRRSATPDPATLTRGGTANAEELAANPAWTSRRGARPQRLAAYMTMPPSTSSRGRRRLPDAASRGVCRAHRVPAGRRRDHQLHQPVLAEKATHLWLSKLDEEVALCGLVRDYFYFGPPGGWQNVSSADLSPHESAGDPMWMVSAVKR